jgi:ppGpp synthetase/RelA/SpoT-type nucleotidyltranferase
MTFSPVPTESKSQINKAGQILAKGENVTEEEAWWARDLADRWRACHAYPINTFQSTLRRKIKKYYGEIIVAQRLKRMPTIVDKLKRFPAMQLTTMQDIGGVRAVLGRVDDVVTLAKEYRESRFEHELIDEKNYIQNPRDEDGYRSLHLIYKYRNKMHPSYDGLRIELQIRTKLQHTWATAVETMGTLLGQALKSRQGDKEWLDFFAIVSSAFAYKENSIPIPRFKDMSRKETFRAVADAEAELQALEQMRGFSIAVEQIGKSKGSAYHLIILNSLEHSVEIKAYDRDSFEKAVTDYSKFEADAAKGKQIEPVLVSAGPIDMLRRAYPNFFLDISGFVDIVEKIVSSIRK